MSDDSDLADWGEPPATPAEEALGTLLDKVLAQIESGKAVSPEALRADRPDLLQRGQELVRTVGLLYECAVCVWENTVMPPDDDPLPGRFRFLQVLGEGAFGKVWLGEDLKLGRKVAVKTLKIPATSTIGPQALEALRKEAHHLAQLQHPNIVQVFAWEEAAGEHYLVLQYVGGGSLADRLKKEKVFDWRTASRYIADVGEGLLHAHKLGIIHRDIKPANILWNADRDEAMLTDFGVSAHLADPGSVAGTPAYMPFDGQTTPAVDVYSMAATLFHLVTGELPFRASGIANLARQVQQGLPDPDDRFQGVPEPLEAVIRAGLAAAPGQRPKLTDFVDSLRGALNKLLVDDLGPAPGKGATAAVNLQVVVSRLEPDGTFRKVGAAMPGSGKLSRDMAKVPPPPNQVVLRTGDRVRIEVVAGETGQVTVFNIGPTGNLHLLYPDDPAAPPAPAQAGVPLRVMDVQMTPPTGKERLFAVWSRRPLSLELDRLASLVGHTQPVKLSRGYRTSRDMCRVKEAVQRTSECHSVIVLELDHHA